MHDYIKLNIAVVFTLIGVITAIHPKCVPSPCANNGKCYFNKTLNDVECFCPAGFHGQFCYDINLCASVTCLNGGHCVPVPLKLSHTCVCQPGFTGPRCGQAISHCASNPCKNGRCIEMGSTYMCQCSPGYTGQWCETAAGLCTSTPCNHYDAKARCSPDDTSYTCQCSSDAYFGLNCESSSQGCDHQEESYCICAVNNLPVKFSLPTPSPYSGVDTRDLIAAITGILLGWLVGSTIFGLYYCCCTNGYGLSAFGGSRDNKKKPLQRPQTAASSQTMTTGYSYNSRPPGSISQVHPVLKSQGGNLDPPMATNIYRAGFTDDMTHVVSNRKSPSTYTSGSKDW